jgi:hypothetical protein
MTVVVTVKIQINRDQIQNSQLIAVTETLTRDNINVQFKGIVSENISWIPLVNEYPLLTSLVLWKFMTCS